LLGDLGKQAKLLVRIVDVVVFACNAGCRRVVGKEHKRKFHILANKGLGRLIQHAEKRVIELFEIMPVEELKTHGLGVLQICEHGMNREHALKVSPDAGRGSSANREAIILHLVKKVKNERTDAKANHRKNEFEQQLHVDQRSAMFRITPVGPFLQFLADLGIDLS
jgi:hypothetical protein